MNRPTPGNRSIQNETRSGYLDGGGNAIAGNSRNQVYLYDNYDAGGIAVQSVDLGGGNTIGPSAAAEVVSLLEPKLVIPMHFQTPASKATLEPLERFLKEVGAPTAADERQPKLSTTKSTLPSETKVQVLDYRG